LDSNKFGLRSETLGALPVINHFLGRLGLDSIVAGICALMTPSDDRPRQR